MEAINAGFSANDFLISLKMDLQADKSDFEFKKAFIPNE